MGKAPFRVNKIRENLYALEEMRQADCFLD